MNPYRHTGYDKTVEEAVSEALSTFNEDNPLFPNDQVFITDATGDYKNATFIDGNGKQVPYATAHKIVSDAYRCLLKGYRFFFGISLFVMIHQSVKINSFFLQRVSR